MPIGLDSDGNGQLTWGEVRNKHDEIRAYALSRLALSADQQVCTTQVLEQLIDHHTDGAYSVLRFRSDCDAPIERLAVDYKLLFDIDAQHKGLLRLTQGGQTSIAIFSRELHDSGILDHRAVTLDREHAIYSRGDLAHLAGVRPCPVLACPPASLGLDSSGRSLAGGR